MTLSSHRARPGQQPRSWTMRGLGVISAAYAQLSEYSARGRQPVGAVDRRLRLRVAETTALAEDVVGLRLEPVDPATTALPAWRPGAHLDLELPGGLLRQYSLCGRPDDRDHYRVAVRRIADGGGGSLAAHRLVAGDEVTVRGPRNAFPYLERDRYLFVAGGIGITPILPMVRDAAGRSADWCLVYTGRTLASMPFVDELRTLAGAEPDRVQLHPDDEFGVPDADDILACAPPHASAYVCGPPPLVSALRAAVTACPHDTVRSLHSERFSAPPVVDGEPFEVTLARTGGTVSVARDESALTAIRAVLPDVAYSCRQGFCGTCPVTVLDGTGERVEHRDRCLSDAERVSRMAICVSRASGPVTLDV